jgi:hypothetical protein
VILLRGLLGHEDREISLDLPIPWTYLTREVRTNPMLNQSAALPPRNCLANHLLRLQARQASPDLRRHIPRDL